MSYIEIVATIIATCVIYLALSHAQMRAEYHASLAEEQAALDEALASIRAQLDRDATTDLDGMTR